MTRICDVIEPMKEDFIVCKLYHTCGGCSAFIVNGVRYESKRAKDGGKYLQICENCYNNELKLPINERFKWIAGGANELKKIEFIRMRPSTLDPDPLVKSDFFNTRQSYLELCQGNHYQYDFLRRAKHSSMMTLYHIHNPLEPSFIHSCNLCSSEIKIGYRFNCRICPDFDICQRCQSVHGHEHPLAPICVTATNTAGTHHNTNRNGRSPKKEATGALSKEQEDELQKEKERQLQAHLDLLVHSSECNDSACEKISFCSKMKLLINHGIECKEGIAKSCKLCVRGILLF